MDPLKSYHSPSLDLSLCKKAQDSSGTEALDSFYCCMAINNFFLTEPNTKSSEKKSKKLALSS